MSCNHMMHIHIPSNLKIIVFDLDETLHNNSKSYMPLTVREILTHLYHNNIILTIASLNTNATMFLENYNILHMFSFVECRKHSKDCVTEEDIEEYTSLTKTKMLQRLMNKCNVNHDEVLFFDDCFYNIIDAKDMKIKSIIVNPTKLLTWKNIYDGFSLFDIRKRRYSLD